MIKQVVLVGRSYKYRLTATSGNPHGAIVIRGCNSVVTWRSSVAEDWYGFTFCVLNNRTSALDSGAGA